MTTSRTLLCVMVLVSAIPVPAASPQDERAAAVATSLGHAHHLLWRRAVAAGFDDGSGVADPSRRQAAIDAYVGSRIRPVEPGEQALQARYRELVRLVGQREYRIRLLQSDDAAAVKQAHERAQAGVPFERLASELSRVPSAARGGDLGWVGFPQPPTFGQTNGVPLEIARVLPHLAPGQVSEPLALSGSWALVLLEAVRDTRLPSFESVRETLRTLFLRESTLAQARALGDDILREAMDARP
ncbi:MAG: peptidylprolyl isomerase [Methyloversatilis sp.]|nr:peptidylprolyl isomerase [Methyloversatilis sp.]